jgi:hypothetical protein
MSIRPGIIGTDRVCPFFHGHFKKLATRLRPLEIGWRQAPEPALLTMGQELVGFDAFSPISGLPEIGA